MPGSQTQIMTGYTKSQNTELPIHNPEPRSQRTKNYEVKWLETREPKSVKPLSPGIEKDSYAS